MDKRSEVVLLHDVGRNVFCRYAHVFVAIHGRAAVKNSMSAVSIFAFRVATVLLRRILIVSRSRSADLALVVDAIAANGKADAVRFNLV